MDKDDSEHIEVHIDDSYPKYQLAKALLASEGVSARALQWQQVLQGINDGSLSIGSREPVENTPAWVTLDVVKGGFATGHYMAGGELIDTEVELAEQLGISINENTRAQLNAWFLGEEGFAYLEHWLASGHYRIDVPEEGALLSFCWLLNRGDSARAASLLEAILPWFGKLRFFPVDQKRSALRGERVSVSSVGEVIKSLKLVQRNERMLAQREAITVWGRLQDEMTSLILETGQDGPPGVRMGDDGKPWRNEQGQYRLEGGRLFQQFPEDWFNRAEALLQEHWQAEKEHQRCLGRRRPGTPYCGLLKAIEACVEAPGMYPERRAKYCHIAIARHIAKHGIPGSPRHRAWRQSQLEQIQAPLYSDIAAVLVGRLRDSTSQGGLEDVSLASMPIAESEATASVAAGSFIPALIQKKVMRARLAPISELVESGLVSSADVFAELLPSVTAEVKNNSFPGDQSKRLYSDLYCAFRRRRSLLLLNFASQVKLEELPWVHALQYHQNPRLSDEHIARNVLHDLVALAITHFPQAILPNKLLQEFRALIKQAKLDVPMVDEIAADIFMGGFSDKFAQAEIMSSKQLKGSIYDRYYHASDPAFQGVSFSKRCDQRARACGSSGGGVAANGMVLEQQQILTTQNLLPLYTALGLGTTLKDELPELAQECFKWLCRRLQLGEDHYHARLVSVKKSAYAWRQMLFYLSVMSRDQQLITVSAIRQHYAAQAQEFKDRFQYVIDGLNQVVDNDAAVLDYSQQFIGWSTGGHRLLV